MFVCFLVLLIKVKPDWGEAFGGYIPSKKLFETKPDALYTGTCRRLPRSYAEFSFWSDLAVGILGATVMPHALFLGSYLATQDRVSTTAPSLPVSTRSPDHQAINLYTRFRNWFASLFAVSRVERIAASRDYLNKYGRENNDLTFIRAHLSHGLTDVIMSLFGLAVPVNSA